jgi:type I restriction enzyme S subunit
MSQTAQASLFPAKQLSTQELWPLPSGWEWVPEICEAIVGGGTPDRGNPRYWGGTIPWASVKDLKSDELTSTQESITPEDLDQRDSVKWCAKRGQWLSALG